VYNTKSTNKYKEGWLFHMDHGTAGRWHKITREWRHGVGVHEREVIISIYKREGREKEE
jgi:hypothetical protein